MSIPLGTVAESDLQAHVTWTSFHNDLHTTVSFFHINSPATPPETTERFQLTSGMGTTAYQVISGPGTIVELINVDSNPQNAVVNLYDSMSLTPSVSSLVYSAQLDTSQATILNIPVTNGIVIQASTAVTADGVLLVYEEPNS